MDLIYPKHAHPHGIENTLANQYRIWVCEECGYIFTDEEARNEQKSWGHPCNQFKNKRCESHLEPYVPEIQDLAE